MEAAQDSCFEDETQARLTGRLNYPICRLSQEMQKVVSLGRREVRGGVGGGGKEADLTASTVHRPSRSAVTFMIQRNPHKDDAISLISQMRKPRLREVEFLWSSSQTC